MVRILGWVILPLLLVSCASTSTNRQDDYFVAKTKVAEITLHDVEQLKQAGGARTTLPDEDFLRIFNWLASGDYESASKWLNKALSYEIDNSSLQFLNGLTYHLMSARDVSKRSLAREGYMLAIRFNQNNWVARRFLGMLEMENRNYVQALHHLSQAALFNAERDLLEYVGSAAYLAHQPTIAAGVFNQLLALDPTNQQYQSTYALTLAALGLNQQALAVANTMTSAIRQYTLKRIGDWDAYHQRNHALLIERKSSSSNLVINDASLLAQASAPPESWLGPDQIEDMIEDVFDTTYDNQQNNTDNSDKSADNGRRTNQMVILDVVIIRSEEEAITSAGVNLLDGLNILFDYREGSQLSPDRIVGNISTGKLQYTLNIMNTASSHSEVLARPSLVALDGKTSTFFSGVNINAAAISGGGEDSGGATIAIEKDVGVSLGVKPTFLEDGKIQLDIHARHGFVTKPDEDVKFDLRVDTLKTEIDGSVVMDIGNTLILSGLNERETRVDRSGVPFLQDIPVIQYFFSRRTTLDFHRSVLILVTPRVPGYSNKNGGENEIDGMMKLQSRHADWFTPYPSWLSVSEHLKATSQLYNEFRTEDVEMSTWKNRATLKARLLDAFQFLYY